MGGRLRRVSGERGGFKGAEAAAVLAGKVASQVPSSVGDVSGTGEADRLPGISGVRGSGDPGIRGSGDPEIRGSGDPGRSFGVWSGGSPYTTPPLECGVPTHRLED